MFATLRSKGLIDKVLAENRVDRAICEYFV